MEIENNHLSILARQTNGAAAPSGAEKEARAGQTGQSPAGDSISLTPAAQLLRDAEARVADQPVVDAQRVDAVRESIANGSFSIDPARIADRMMGMEQALGRLH